VGEYERERKGAKGARKGVDRRGAKNSGSTPDMGELPPSLKKKSRYVNRVDEAFLISIIFYKKYLQYLYF